MHDHFDQSCGGNLDYLEVQLTMDSINENLIIVGLTLSSKVWLHKVYPPLARRNGRGHPLG